MQTLQQNQQSKKEQLPSAKKLYRSPKLTSHGKVTKITAGGSAGDDEPGMGVPPDRRS